MGQKCSKEKRRHCKCWTGSNHEIPAVSQSRNNSDASAGNSETASTKLLTEIKKPGPSHDLAEEHKKSADNVSSTSESCEQINLKQISKEKNIEWPHPNSDNVKKGENSAIEQPPSSPPKQAENVGHSHHGDKYSMPGAHVTGNVGPHGTTNIESHQSVDKQWNVDMGNATLAGPTNIGNQTIHQQIICSQSVKVRNSTPNVEVVNSQYSVHDNTADKKSPSDAVKDFEVRVKAEANARVKEKAKTRTQAEGKAARDVAIKKHQEEHMKSLPENVLLYDEKLKHHQLPDVHPQMHKYGAYEGEGPVEKEKFIPSTKHKSVPPLYQQPVSFDTLLNLTSRKKFITLVGPPGSGKTTLSKQLAKRKKNQSVMFLLRFMDLNHKEPLTCKQLFVDYLCPELDDNTKEYAFQWMVKNQDKCVFVFDGFDQTEMSLENLKPTSVDYKTPMAIDQLVANLCCKKFFKDSLLLFTSRPHKILKVPFELRPDVTIHVDDLSTADMEKLFYALTGDKADELWEMVSNKTPQLFGLCHNPLLLQFIIFAFLHEGISKVETVTEVFETVLDHLRYSEHARNEDIAKLWEPIGKIAYEGMLEETVVFNTKSLGDLEATDVQDVIIVFARSLGFPGRRLFDGDQLFYFSHQTLQEIFAARYICEFMSDEEFNEIIPEVAKGGHWSMVRRFLCGLLLKNKKRMQTTSCKTADQLSTKKQGLGPKFKCIALAARLCAESYQFNPVVLNLAPWPPKAFRENLIEYMKTNVRGNELIDLLTDLQECSDDEKDLLESYLAVKFDFSRTPISSGEAHALAEILPRLNRPLKCLVLTGCNLNSDTLRMICGGISKMKHGVEELNLSENEFGDTGVDIISASGCLKKVKVLILVDCRISDDGEQILRREVERLGLSRSTVFFG